MHINDEVVTCDKDNKGLVLLLFIFCFMYLLNIFTPLLLDDYFLTFVWPAGMTINSLPENANRIECLSDVFESLKSYYFNWGGRIPGQTLMTMFAWQGKQLYNFFNAFMIPLLIVEIYWLSHEGRISFVFDVSYIFWIFFALWTFNISFIDSILWLSGSCEYLWMMVFLLAFLLPYINNYYNNNSLQHNKLPLSVAMFFLGLLAGCSRETVICWIILILSYWLFCCHKKKNLQIWKVTGYVGFCIGYGLLIFAPGNAVRFATLGLTVTDIFFNSHLLKYKINEIAKILLFQSFLWFFLYCFFIRFKKKYYDIKTEKRYLNIIYLNALIAFCPLLMMFFIPTNGLRVSFVSLVFLIVAATYIFRLQEKEKFSVISKAARSLLKGIGSFYFIVTVSISLLGNYLNWCCWKDISFQLSNNGKELSDVVIEVKSPITEHNSLWFWGSGMVHLVGFPVYENENDPINMMISKYYGIKGIKVTK